jgi:hypothetical protein
MNPIHVVASQRAWQAQAMAFTIYARGPIEEGSQDPYNKWEAYSFDDDARYWVLPSGALVVDKDGEGTCWMLVAGRWQWVRSAKHRPGEEGDSGDGNLGAYF